MSSRTEFLKNGPPGHNQVYAENAIIMKKISIVNLNPNWSLLGRGFISCGLLLERVAEEKCSLALHLARIRTRQNCRTIIN